MDSPKEATDKAMMARCIELSRIAVTKGEYPFGTVIALDGQIAAEAINSTVRDADMSARIPQIFGAVPEVVSGIMLHEAQQAWRDWNPLAWQMIKLRGLLTEPCVHDGHVHMQPAHGPSIWHYLQRLFARSPQPRIEAQVPNATRRRLRSAPHAVGTLPIVD